MNTIINIYLIILRTENNHYVRTISCAFTFEWIIFLQNYKICRHDMFYDVTYRLFYVYSTENQYYFPAFAMRFTCSRITSMVDLSAKNTEFKPCCSCAGSPV